MSKAKKVNSDVAYNFIRSRILSGEYAPGHPLLTESLAREIGVSRTPVREALGKLEVDGLVTITARHGASVTKMGIKEFGDLCHLRMALESHAAYLAALNHTAADFRELKFAIESLRETAGKLIDAKDGKEHLLELCHYDVRFHIAIMTAANNELMKKDILRLHVINRVVSSVLADSPVPVASKTEMNEDARVSLAQHEEIFEAIIRRDGDAAKRAMERHIQAVIDKSLRTMQPVDSAMVGRPLTPEELAYSA
jgi:DNA-binding GntR family transcriptional regulator